MSGEVGGEDRADDGETISTSSSGYGSNTTQQHRQKGRSRAPQILQIVLFCLQNKLCLSNYI